MNEALRKIDERVADLLLTWEDSVATGAALLPESLCRDCPELVGDLEREIARLRAVDLFLFGKTDGSAGETGPRQNDAASAARFPVLPGYELLEEIGRGGMGVVFKARQQSLGRLVAVKMLAGSRWAQPGTLARLRQEARALSRLNHPHVVQVIDVIETGETPAIVLEFVDGLSLAKKQAGAPLAPKEAAQIALTLSHTLAAVHEQGLLHRDIKPANVLVSRTGEIKISDFGIAKEVGNADGLTMTGDVLGSPAYMAPEQMEGQHSLFDVRTDVYGLGATLYEMLTGRPPFVGGTVVETLDQVREREPVAPRVLQPGIPRDLETICLTCLEKKPSRRFATAQELADDLERHLRGEPVRSRPIGTIDRVVRWCRRRPAVSSVAGLTVAAMLVIASLLVAHQRDLSEFNRDLTQANSDLELAAQTAKEHQQRAEDNERQTKDALYAADMSRAAAAWRDEDTRGLVNLLERHLPRKEEFDRRGFEWWYLRRQANVSSRRILLEVGSPLYVVCQSPDRRFLATAGRDAIVRLIDVETGVVAREFATGQIEVNGVAFAPDGQELATAGDDGTIRICNLETGSERLKWKAHPGQAFQLIYTPDGRRLVSCGDDSVIHIFDPQSGAELATLDGHQGVVQSLTLAIDGRTLASTGGDRTARIWNLENGKQSNVFVTSHSAGPVAILPERNLLIIGNDDGLLQTVDIREAREIAAVKHLDRMGALAMHPNGGLLATGDRGGKIRLRKIGADGNFAADHFQPWQAHQGNVYSLVWSDDGSRLVSAGEDGRVISWSLAAASHEAGPDRIDIDVAGWFAQIPRTTSVVTTGMQANSLAQWNWLQGTLENRTVPKSTVLESGTGTVDVSRDGTWLLLGAETVIRVCRLDEVFNRPFDESSIVLRGAETTFRVPRFSPDSQTIAVPCHHAADDGHPRRWSVRLLRPPNFTRVERIPVTDAKVVAFAPDGKRLALACDAGIVLWDLSHQSIVWEQPQHDISQMTFSLDGKLVAAGGDDRRVFVRNADDGSIIFQLASHRSSVTALAFSSDSATLATGSLDGSIKLWHIPTGQELFELRGPRTTSIGLEFTDDGRHLLAHVDAGLGHTAILVFKATDDKSAN